MAEQDWLSARFAEHQEHLQKVAYRMLGSRSEAEDAVQEAWARVGRADTGQVENPGGWLTTVVARVCLNMMEARRNRPEQAAGALPPEPRTPQARSDAVGADPEDEALLADSVGVALMVVLETLTPAERLAFVLHDIFAVSFGEIGRVIDRSPAAARQLASRARRRVRGAAETSDAARSAKREIVAAFLAAARGGDFHALLDLLDPDAVAVGEFRGAETVASFFTGRARAARLALVDGEPAAVWTHHGVTRAVIAFTVEDGRITRIAADVDPGRLRDRDVVFLPST